MHGTSYIPEWHLFSDRTDQAQALADHVADALRRALVRSDGVTLLVSGGRSPAHFFECLAVCALDWERVWVMPVDERASPPEPEDRNEWLIRRTLLTGQAARARFVPLDQPMAARALRERVPWPPVLSVLGMGEDGHSASWFPGDAASLEALQNTAEPAVVATRASAEPVERLTLNWSALAQTRERVLLISGDAKRTLLERIAAEGLSWQQYPVARLLSAPLRVFWSP
ncbi:MAG: 6-phosphogluconolactonase [Halospina sp.]